MAIITKHKDTTGAAAAALEVGELGVNTVDGTLSVGTAGGNVDLVSPGTTTLPTGTDTQTLRNDSGTWESTSDLVVDSSGNVGIGNTSPNVKLVVAGSTRVTTSFIAPSGDDHTAPAYTWNGDQDTGMFRVADNIIGFTTAATERMRIGSSGVVTLGGASGDRVAGTDNAVGQDLIHRFLTLSQSQYNALSPPDANTLYIIV